VNDDMPSEVILDGALQLAEEIGWDRLTLHELADTLALSLRDIQAHYRQKDDLAEAWFDRADRALLDLADRPDWLDLTPRERLHAAIAAWLAALAPHRRLTADMLRYKLQPDHLHLQALGVARIRRTVQWIREVARLPARGLLRELQEVALTGIYLATFTRWLADDSADAAATHALLDRLLGAADWLIPSAAIR